MTVRMSHKTVSFTRPFSLSGIDELQPAGSYTVETHERLLPGLSVAVWRWIATLIFLSSRPGGAFVERVVSIDPLELETAQERDAAVALRDRLSNEPPCAPTRYLTAGPPTRRRVDSKRKRACLSSSELASTA